MGCFATFIASRLILNSLRSGSLNQYQATEDSEARSSRSGCCTRESLRSLRSDCASVTLVALSDKAAAAPNVAVGVRSGAEAVNDDVAAVSMCFLAVL